MAIKKPVSYKISPAKGQALLNFQGRRFPDKVELFETTLIEQIRHIEKAPKLKLEKQKELNADFTNLLIHGDCLSACAYLKNQNIKVDLVYIDPPFASGANYAKKIYLRNGNKANNIENEDNAIGEEIMYGDIWQKEDYLNWLYERLLAIREVMNEIASIYVHLDWHIGHYVKVMLDEIFGENNFKNEIVWYYPDNFQGNVNRFAINHNIIFWYTVDESNFTYNKILIELGKTVKRDKRIWSKELQKLIAAKDENGKTIYSDFTEKKLDDVWTIGQTSTTKEYSSEFTGYNTQKPREVLRRVIESGSNENMIVADFFSGSGTTAKVASELTRKFIACDIGVNAIQTARDSLVKAKADFDILKINDGVRLFRNPAQTQQKIFSLIDGFKNRTQLELGEFWDGGIAGTSGSYVPVKFVGIQEKLTKQLLDFFLEQIYELEAEDNVEAVKIIYAHKDLEIDQNYIEKELRHSKRTTIKVELISLDNLLGAKRDLLFPPDNADIEVKKEKDKYKVTIRRYFSNYLKTKIDDFNAKKVKKQKEIFDEDEKGKQSSKKIKLSKNGLELIESVQFDTTLRKDGVWESNLDLEDKADIKEKIKAIYVLPTDKFKMKIRNIAGDEITLDYSS
jgi:adenine-specific DNA-methyltransferase